MLILNFQDFVRMWVITQRTERNEPKPATSPRSHQQTPLLWPHIPHTDSSQACLLLPSIPGSPKGRPFYSPLGTAVHIIILLGTISSGSRFASCFLRPLQN